MRRMQCKCGSEKFNADKHSTALRCVICFQRYWWKDNSGWTEITLYAEAKQRIVQTLISTVNKPFEWAENILHHPKHEKKSAEKPAAKYRSYASPTYGIITESHFIEERIRAGWKEEIKLLDHGEKLYFPNHAHKGRLRGKDIAKTCHRDLTRIGLKTKISFDDDGASLEIQHD